eukprot:5135625-Pleurochrysis_carterae.AAC.3
MGTSRWVGEKHDCEHTEGRGHCACAIARARREVQNPAQLCLPHHRSPASAKLVAILYKADGVQQFTSASAASYPSDPSVRVIPFTARPLKDAKFVDSNSYNSYVLVQVPKRAAIPFKSLDNSFQPEDHHTSRWRSQTTFGRRGEASR